MLVHVQLALQAGYRGDQEGGRRLSRASLASSWTPVQPPKRHAGLPGLRVGGCKPGHGRAPQEAELPSAPDLQHLSLACRAPSHFPARCAPILSSIRRAYLRPWAGHAAFCACAAGNEPGQDEWEAAPWCPPPAGSEHPTPHRRGVRAPRRFQPRCTHGSVSYAGFFSTRVDDVLTYHSFSSDAQPGATNGREEL